MTEIIVFTTKEGFDRFISDNTGFNSKFEQLDHSVTKDETDLMNNVVKSIISFNILDHKACQNEYLENSIDVIMKFFSKENHIIYVDNVLDHLTGYMIFKVAREHGLRIFYSTIENKYPFIHEFEYKK